MQELDKNTTPEVDKKPIGRWLWLIMISIVATGLQVLIDLVTTTKELLADDWNLYFQTTDEILRTRLNIYAYIIIAMVIGLGILTWSLINFFKRKKRFPAMFLGLLGYFILTEVLRLYFLDYYAGLTDQDASNIESTLAKTGIVAIIAGLYLNKAKHPKEIFINQ